MTSQWVAAINSSDRSRGKKKPQKKHNYSAEIILSYLCFLPAWTNGTDRKGDSERIPFTLQVNSCSRQNADKPGGLKIEAKAGINGTGIAVVGPELGQSPPPGYQLLGTVQRRVVAVCL